MEKRNSELEQRIFAVKNQTELETVAMDVFRFQYQNNPVYNQYVRELGRKPQHINSLKDIPFLPIEFFKTHDVLCKQQVQTPPTVFTSSGTTGMERSRHIVAYPDIYETNFNRIFHYFYGNSENYCILALLPAYLERKGSSLVYMMQQLINQSKNKNSGFYLYNHEPLYHILQYNEKAQQPTLLLGVTFALLDFATQYGFPLQHTIVMETGGMKGRREELTRSEVHNILKTKFQVDTIHSEYGMTELLSQAYSKGNGVFYLPPPMKILIRDTYDPFFYLEHGKTGGINVLDLANLYSCSFIETKDLGQTFADGGFEVTGRFDNSDIRGCNLLTINN